jgi:hypothetical protein
MGNNGNCVSRVKVVISKEKGAKVNSMYSSTDAVLYTKLSLSTEKDSSSSSIEL